MNGWMNRWMDDSNNHPKISDEPQGTFSLLCRSFSWPASTEDFIANGERMDDWGKFNHPKI
jgi:hypothetical protein